jgi:hypothetical protein
MESHAPEVASASFEAPFCELFHVRPIEVPLFSRWLLAAPVLIGAAILVHPVWAEPRVSFDAAESDLAWPPLVVAPDKAVSNQDHADGPRLIDPELLDDAGPQWRFGEGQKSAAGADRFESLLEHAIGRHVAPAGPSSHEELARLQQLLDPEGLEILHSPAASRRELARMRSVEILPQAKPPLAAPRIPEHVSLPEEGRHIGLFVLFCVLETLFMAALLWRRPSDDGIS